jgi:hypothetical protein
MLGAEIGPCSTSETKLAPLLFKLLNEEMHLLVDRGFSGYELWQAAAATGAQLCWRTKSNAVLPVSQALPESPTCRCSGRPRPIPACRSRSG